VFDRNLCPLGPFEGWRRRVAGEVVLIETAVVPRLEGGWVRFDLHSGEKTIHCAMSVSNFLASFANSGEVARKWRGGLAEVRVLEQH
jgi:hypothetical protein